MKIELSEDEVRGWQTVVVIIVLLFVLCKGCEIMESSPWIDSNSKEAGK